MGVFRQPIEIGASSQGPSRTIDAIVDSGSAYTWIPASILVELGVKPAFRRTFIMADGRQVERDMATVHVRINGREHPTPCAFGDEGSLILLGAVTLEELGLGIDPINKQLIDIPALLAAALRHRHVPASEPGVAEECRLTTEDGHQRQPAMKRLFAQLAEQRQARGANEFVFRGDPTTLWHDVSQFVDEESQCCPFYTYEQIETPDGVTLRVIGQPEPIELK